MFVSTQYHQTQDLHDMGWQWESRIAHEAMCQDQRTGIYAKSRSRKHAEAAPCRGMQARPPREGFGVLGPRPSMHAACKHKVGTQWCVGITRHVATQAQNRICDQTTRLEE